MTLTERWRMRGLPIVGGCLLLSLFLAACELEYGSDEATVAETSETGDEEEGFETPAYDDLPSNPPVPATRAGTHDQNWYFAYKSYDNTFRIRWPTYFYTAHRLGQGSYTLANGQRAAFRSYDTDGGAMRPSYTIPGPSSRFSGEVLCLLYNARGELLAWFVTPASGGHGRLP